MASARKAFMGISLGSRRFSVDYIRRVIEYAKLHFDGLMLLIADTPHAFTFMATKGASYEAALKKVRLIGEQKVRSAQRAVRSISGAETFVEIRQWDDIAYKPEAKAIRAGVDNLYSKDHRFKEDIKNTFEQYLADAGYGHIAADQKEIGIKYILDEFAIMIFLQQVLGFSVQIAPVSCPIFLENYYNGQYQPVEGLPQQPELKPFEHIMI